MNGLNERSGNMKASFVIATYNRSDDLVRCVDSILRQEDCEYEILIMDDASTDGTGERIRERYGDQVELIERAENRGSIKNRNEGAKLARGDVLFIIDDDSELTGAQTVNEVMREFEDPRVGALAIPYMQQGILRKSAPTEDGQYAVASYVGCSSAVRRELFLSLGGYDAFFHHQVEESDFCIRMMQLGALCKIARVSQPILHHESPIRNCARIDYLSRRNSLLYIWKNAPLQYLITNLLITSLRGIGHAFTVRRIYSNLKGLLHGYGAICLSLFGNGSRRQPVSPAVYKVTLRMRQAPLPMDEVERVLDRNGRGM